MNIQPSAHRLQALDTWFGDGALGIGTNIEQIIAAFADDVHQIADQLRRRLPIVVVGLEAPGVIDGGGRLPVDFSLQLRRDGVVLRSGVVAQRIAQPTANQAVGLQFMHQVEQLLALLPRDNLRRVEPDDGDRTVVRQDFAHLWLDVILDIVSEVLLVLVEIPSVAVAIGMMPVLRL